MPSVPSPPTYAAIFVVAVLVALVLVRLVSSAVHVRRRRDASSEKRRGSAT